MVSGTATRVGSHPLRCSAEDVFRRRIGRRSVSCGEVLGSGRLSAPRHLSDSDRKIPHGDILRPVHILTTGKLRSSSTSRFMGNSILFKLLSKPLKSRLLVYGF